MHGSRRRSRGAAAMSVVLFLAGRSPVQAQSIDLSHATLEELMNIEVTSASRKEQRAGDIPAAVFVLTQEDIQRSGMQTLAGLLRLVPGLDVARVNADTWAVSARGFNGVFANKLLVMIDGRTVFNPMFGGVFWGIDEPPVDDIERVEVIRGPGGATWGANAVNGVVNVITKRAADTQGGAARVRAGTKGSGVVFGRYGGTIGSAAYRVFSIYDSNGQFAVAGGDEHAQRSNAIGAGTRIDWPNLTLDGALTKSDRTVLWLDFSQMPRSGAYVDPTPMLGGHVMGRWSHAVPRGRVQVQSFFDAFDRDDPIGEYRRRTGDVDVSAHISAGDRHDVVFGGGYRFVAEEFLDGIGVRISPNSEHQRLLNVFGQDEVALRADRRLRLTVGAKFEHNDVAGTNVVPTARLFWSVVPDAQSAWAAVSRAVRPPSMLNRNMSFSFPYGADAATGLPVYLEYRGNPKLQPESVREVEAGYRFELKSRAAIDVAVFTAAYRNLPTLEPGSPEFDADPSPRVVLPIQSQNLLRTDTRGLEISGRWDAAARVRVDGNVALFGVTPHIDPASRDTSASVDDQSAPRRQWRLHGAVDLARFVTTDVALSGTGAIRSLDVPAFVRADAQVEWRVSQALAIDFVGQNLFDASHLEFSAVPELILATPVPRSFHAQLRMRFK